MLRTLTFALAMLAVPAALAQTSTTYDPKIAYTQISGQTNYLYLANADGSRAVRVATATGDINGVDFAPGGGRIAFSDRAGLKVVSYTASNTSITVNSVVTLVGARVAPPDFSDDGNRILYYQSATTVEPSGFRAVPAAGGTPVLLFQDTSGGQGRWLRSAVMGNAFAFLKVVGHGPNVPVDYEIWTVLLDGNDTVISAGSSVSTASQAFKAIEDFDISRTRNSLLITANYPSTVSIVEFDLASGVVTDKGVSGFRAHYSADDSRIIFRNLPYLGSADYVNSFDLNTGYTTRLTKKGSYGVTDARP